MNDPRPRIAVEDAWFRDVVNQELLGKSDEELPENTREMLRNPKVVRTWRRQLAVFKSEHEGQARRRKAGVQRTIARKRLGEVTQRQVDEALVKYEDWKARSATFRLEIERRMHEAAAIIELLDEKSSRARLDDLREAHRQLVEEASTLNLDQLTERIRTLPV